MHTSPVSRWSTVATVCLLAAIAAVVSYAHMFELALRHGEPDWRAGLFPLSVDGMIVASSMSLLSDARQGRRGGALPWALLIVGSAASLAANVAVADPTVWSRVMHAWPSFALMGAYELLMRRFRVAARGERTAYADDALLATGDDDVTDRDGGGTGLERQDPAPEGLHVVAVGNDVAPRRRPREPEGALVETGYLLPSARHGIEEAQLSATGISAAARIRGEEPAFCKAEIAHVAVHELCAGDSITLDGRRWITAAIPELVTTHLAYVRAWTEDAHQGTAPPDGR